VASTPESATADVLRDRLDHEARAAGDQDEVFTGAVVVGLASR
jgi:hypothetical protein